MSLHKLFASVLGAISAFLLSLPADSHRALGVALWFLVLDQLSGVVAARMRGSITSRAFRMGLKDKLVCYATIIGFALGISLVANQPSWYAYLCWGVCASEALSLMENLRTMLRKGGTPMRPLSRFLDAVATLIEKITGVVENKLLLATRDATREPSLRAVTDEAS